MSDKLKEKRASFKDIRLVMIQQGINESNAELWLQSKTEAELDALLLIDAITYKEQVTDKAYAYKRKKEYPAIEELVEALWENNQEKIASLEEKRQSIKTKYPKPQ